MQVNYIHEATRIIHGSASTSGDNVYVPDGHGWFREPTKAEASAIKTKASKMEAKAVTKDRELRRDNLFGRAVLRIMAISMDREELKSPEAIRAQKDVYDSFYNSALKGNFGTSRENEEVIAAHEAAEAYASNLTKLAHAANRAITAKIKAKDDTVEEMLDYVESLKLTRAKLTNVKIEEIRHVLGV